MICNVFDRLKANIENNAGERIQSGLIVGEEPDTWYCEHGLIAAITTDKKRVFHAVDPALIGIAYETTNIADGA